MKTPKMRFSEIPDHLGGKTVDQKIVEFGKFPNFGPKSEGLPLGRQYREIRENTRKSMKILQKTIERRGIDRETIGKDAERC